MTGYEKIAILLTELGAEASEKRFKEYIASK